MRAAPAPCPRNPRRARRAHDPPSRGAPPFLPFQTLGSAHPPILPHAPDADPPIPSHPDADPPLPSRYFNPPDEEGEDYKGARSLADLKKFAAAELGPGCSVDTLENCSDDQKAQLDEYIKMPAEERDAKLADLKKKLGDAEKAHEDLLKTLQSTYKESMDSLEKLKESSAPTIKLLKAATPSGAKPKGKDEV